MDSDAARANLATVVGVFLMAAVWIIDSRVPVVLDKPEPASYNCHRTVTQIVFVNPSDTVDTIFDHMGAAPSKTDHVSKGQGPIHAPIFLDGKKISGDYSKRTLGHSNVGFGSRFALNADWAQKSGRCLPPDAPDPPIR
mmetsp:Transcript_20717/g.53845  ORF Transcript_20717/g.53845 Transcript_20717/m.53845 type:complete len:139 (+) Transcript_20717:315-731(+)